MVGPRWQRSAKGSSYLGGLACTIMLKNIFDCFSICMSRILISRFEFAFDFVNSFLNHLVSQKSAINLKQVSHQPTYALFFCSWQNFPDSWYFLNKVLLLQLRLAHCVCTCGTFFTRLVLFLHGVHGVVLFLQSKVNSSQHLCHCQLVKQQLTSQVPDQYYCSRQLARLHRQLTTFSWLVIMFIRKHCNLLVFQTKVLRIVYFKTLTAHTDSQFIDNNSLKFVWINNVFIFMYIYIHKL